MLIDQQMTLCIVWRRVFRTGETTCVELRYGGVVRIGGGGELHWSLPLTVMVLSYFPLVPLMIQIRNKISIANGYEGWGKKGTN